MEIYISFFILFAGVPLIFFGMFKAARWSRIKNDELKTNQKDSQEQALKEMLQCKKGSIVNYYTSSLSKPLSTIGYLLAVSIIIFFAILASVLAYHVYQSI